MRKLTFLGTGNYSVRGGRYWNSFVLDGTVLVEPSPTALPHLRRAGVDARNIDAVVISHFHPDHTFGWPFFLLEATQRQRDGKLFVVGPEGVREFLADMMALGGVLNVQNAAHALLDIEYVEVDGTWQEAGPVRFRAVEVDHVPHLRCYGYLLEMSGRTIAYSGDTQMCAGLEQLARNCDALVLECNSSHPWPGHMHTEAVRQLRDVAPDVPFVLTHVDDDVDPTGILNVRVANDFDEFDL